MINVSTAARKFIAESSKTLFKATITFTDETTYEVTGDDVMMGGVTFTEGTSSANAFQVGACVIGSLTLKLNNWDGRFDSFDFTDAVIVPSVGIPLEGGTVWVRKGVFNVVQPDTYGTVIQLQAYDNANKLKTPYSLVTTNYPATLTKIVQDICARCGVQLGNQNFANHAYVVQTRPEDTALSCLDVLSYAAQIAGLYAKCDNTGALYLKWYDTTATTNPPTSTGDGVAVVKAISSMSVFTDDVVITGTRMKAQDEVTEDNDGQEGEYYLYGRDGYVLYSEANPLVLYGQARNCATTMGSGAVGMRFRPFNLTAISDPTIEAGDAIVIHDRSGNIYKSYITNTTYTLGAYQQLSCGARSAARNSATAYSAATQAIVALKDTIKRETNAREVAVERLREMIDESGGLFLTEDVQPGGGTIFYLHDAETLADSSIIWKLTAEAMAVSTDGGQTYPYGIDVSGTAILNRIYAIGLDADYITTGALNVSTPGGLTVLSADVDTGSFRLEDANGNYWDSARGEASFIGQTLIGGTPADTIASNASTALSTANSAKTTANEAKNAQVGGTNLLIDSNHNSVTKRAADANRYFSTPGGSSANVTNSLVKLAAAERAVSGASIALRMVWRASSSGKFAGICYYANKATKMIDGQKYTISCWAKRTGGAANVFLQYGQTSYKASSRMALTTGWKRYSWTFTFTQASAGGTNGARIYFYATPTTASACTVFISGMKLEVGDKATDWSTAPEDDTFGMTNAEALAKKYTNEVSKKDRDYTSEQRTELDNSFNQGKVFNRLTRNGRAQGLILKGNQLYINAQYINTGTLNAGIIKAGVLTDKAGRNKWNMATGYFYTKNAEFENSNVLGTLTSGKTNKAQFKEGTVRFYNGNKNAMTIDGALRFKDGKYGAHITYSQYLVLRGPKLATSTSTTSNGTVGFTGTVTLKNVVFDMNKTMTWCSWGDVQLKFINGLFIGVGSYTEGLVNIRNGGLVG